MSYTKQFEDVVIDRHENWSELTSVSSENGSGKVFIEQGDMYVVLPREYVGDVIKALEKALEKS